MKFRALLMFALLLSVGGLFGCSGSGSGSSDESRLRSRYTQWERAIEAERVDSYMLLFSPDYLDEGYDYVDVRNFAAALFDQYDIVDAWYEDLDIRVSGNTASVWGTEIIDGYDTYNFDSPERLITEFHDIWRYEAGNWYLYGNQRDITTLSKAPFRHSVEAFRARAVKAALPAKAKTAQPSGK